MRAQFRRVMVVHGGGNINQTGTRKSDIGQFRIGQSSWKVLILISTEIVL